MKAIIFGLGSIGQRHLRLLRTYFPEIEILHYCRAPEPFFEKLVDNGVWDVVTSPCFEQDDFAIISNPTESHISCARASAEMGLHSFMEKPIGVNSQGLSELLELVKTKNLIAYVAYPLRFHPFIQYLKNHLPAGGMHFECRTDASKWPSKRKLNHVVLELSHELDLSSYLLGSMRRIRGNCSPDGLRATLVLEHATGIESTCLLDMASPVPARFIRIGDYEYPMGVDDNIYLAQWVHFLKAIKRKQAGVFARTANELRQAAKLFRVMEEYLGTARNDTCPQE